MKIYSITTKDGETIELDKFTLLVGPNNVGKSQTLKDIYTKMMKGHDANTTLVKKIKVDRPASFEDLFEGLDVRIDNQNVGHHIIDGLVVGSESNNSMIRILMKNYKNQFENNIDNDNTFLNLSKFKVFYLDADSRLKVTNKSPNYIPGESSPKNFLQALYGSGSSGEFDKKLKDAFKTTFNMDITLDYSSGLELRFAISKEFGNIPPDPREAYPLMQKYPSIEQQGDGFRSFVAVVLTVLLSKDKIVLLDEPEAFLHPEQARRLGKWLSDHTDSFPCQILVSTHNANFLAGLLSGSQPADIYRLNRTGESTSFTKITSEATQQLSSSPLLSSQRVLEAIFARGVVVCESDSDRIIYNTVAIKEHNNQEILFIHAHNKQTIKNVVALLREASIPTVGVTDIDLLNSSKDFSETLGTFVDIQNLQHVIILRDEIAKHIENSSDAQVLAEIKEKVLELLNQLNSSEHSLSGARSALDRIKSESSRWAAIKKQGVNYLEEPFQSKANEIINVCAENGLFLVPVGELEGWIPLNARKNKWIVPALNVLSQGKCPQNLNNFVKKMQEFIFK